MNTIKYAAQNPDFCHEYGIELQPLTEPSEAVDAGLKAEPKTLNSLYRLESLFAFVDSLSSEELRALAMRIQIAQLSK